MKINNPHDLVGKEVFDSNGNTIGTIDKYWNSWNKEYPGYFFGIRPTESTRDTWFRGTYKLIPIYSDYIKEWSHNVTLNKTMEQLGKFWNKTVHCGKTTCPTDQLVDVPIFDKNHSRVGVLSGWVETNGEFKYYGCFVDPYICENWKLPYNTLMPIPTNVMQFTKDTIMLDQTLDEVKQYWQKYYQF